MISGDDIIYMAATIYGEARGEYFLGKIAVGHVIQNRVKEQKWYGGTIKEVCKKPWQFSCWNANDPNKRKLDLMVRGIEAGHFNQWLENVDFRECLTAALMVIENKAPDDTGGATHYFNPNAVDAPDWTQNATLTGAIGHHKFYKDVD